MIRNPTRPHGSWRRRGRDDQLDCPSAVSSELKVAGAGGAAGLVVTGAQGWPWILT